MAVDLTADAPARRLTGWLAYVSGVAGVISILFAMGMYVMFFTGKTANG